jgi:integrase
MRATGKLTDIQVRTAAPGTHCDGAGLYLSVRHNNRSWLFRYSFAGRSHWMGLGAYPTVTLARAREKAAEARRLLADGGDPLQHKRDRRAALCHQNANPTKSLTFDQCAEQYITSHRAGWRSVVHSQQWQASLRMYVSPILGRLPVASIDTAFVLKALEPIWTTMPTTANRVRNRIELVLSWAKAHGYRDGENPARWRGHLDHLLARPSKLKAVRHYTSLPYAELPRFLVDLRQHEGMAARALEFLILTAARSGEVLGARWSEIDFAGCTWVVPADRMKGHREHRVPLSQSAVGLLERLPRQGEFVFPGRGSRLTPSVMQALLMRMWRRDITPHGFRSSFRDWAAERTAYAREVCEQALAHRVGDSTERAYLRSDLFQQRARLMSEWAAFCETPATTAEVIPIRA